MEKESFYEKLEKAKPAVKAYFDAKKIADSTEFLYVREKCKDSEPHFGSDGPSDSDAASLVTTRKVIRILFGIGMLWGLVLVITGIVGIPKNGLKNTGLTLAVGLSIGIGSFFLLRHLDAKFGESLCAYHQRKEAENEYAALVEQTKAEYRAIVESLPAKKEAMQEKLEEVGLASIAKNFSCYEDFSHMLSYAQKHPNQTTPSSYLRAQRENSKGSSLSSGCGVYSYDTKHTSTDIFRAIGFDRPSDSSSSSSSMKEIQDRMSEKIRNDDAALTKCRKCVNYNKCGYSVMQYSLTCAAFRPK